MSVEIQQISITNLNKDYFTFDRHFSLFQHAHRTIVRFEIVLHKTSCDYVFRYVVREIQSGNQFFVFFHSTVFIDPMIRMNVVNVLINLKTIYHC